MAVLDGNGHDNTEHVLGMLGARSYARLPKEGPGLKDVAGLDVGASCDVQPEPDGIVAMPAGKPRTRRHETVPGRAVRRRFGSGPLIERQKSPYSVGMSAVPDPPACGLGSSPGRSALFPKSPTCEH